MQEKCIFSLITYLQILVCAGLLRPGLDHKIAVQQKKCDMLSLYETK